MSSEREGPLPSATCSDRARLLRPAVAQSGVPGSRAPPTPLAAAVLPSLHRSSLFTDTLLLRSSPSAPKDRGTTGRKGGWKGGSSFLLLLLLQCFCFQIREGLTEDRQLKE